MTTPTLATDFRIACPGPCEGHNERWYVKNDAAVCLGCGVARA